MTTVRFISGAAALASFVHGIHVDVDGRLDERNINATGRLKKSNRTEVVVGSDNTTGHLYALDYWKTAGSGSPPGTQADLTGLKEWALSKGIIKGVEDPGYFASVVKSNIFLFGSNDWIAGNENVYEGAIEDAAPKIPEVLRSFLSDLTFPVATVMKQAFA